MHASFDDQMEESAQTESVYREVVREGTSTAIKASLLIVPIASIALCTGFSLSRASFIASDHILEDPGHEWGQALWPAALYALFGLVVGAGLGWRINTTSGLVGGRAWIIGMMSVMLICVVGVLGSFVIFGGAPPYLVWISTGVIVLTAMCGVTFFSKWYA